MAAPQVLAGWRVVVKFNEKIVAAGFVVDYTIDTAHTEIQTVDNVFPEEYAPESIRVSLSLRVYRTPDNDPVALGLAPFSDSVNGGNIQAQQDFTTSKYISVEIRDKVTDKTVLFLPKAVIVRRTGSGESQSLFTETWSVRSIGYIGPGSQVSGIAGAVQSFFK